MSSYEKFDPSVIKKRIKADEYDSLTGANRAIGKTQNLSDEDRDELKKFAAKHFGVEAPTKKASAKKAAKKAAKTVKKAAKAEAAPKAAVAKKAAKRAAKKVGKRASKKAAAKAAADSEAATQTPAVASKPVHGPGRVRKAPAVNSKQLALPFKRDPDGVVKMMGAVIGSVTQMLDSMKLAQALYPKGLLAESVPTAVRTMTRAVSVLEQYAVSPLDQSQTQVTATKGPDKKAHKAGSRARKASDKPPEPPVDANGAGDHEDMTEEQREEFNRLQDLAGGAEG